MNIRHIPIQRFTLILILVLALFASVFQPQSEAFAAAALTVTPLTWNVIGLDSNNVNAGPNDFPVGARVCNTGDSAATNVVANFVWDSSNALSILVQARIAVCQFRAWPPARVPIFILKWKSRAMPPPIIPRDVITSNVTADAGATTGSTPTPRELFVEHLISQNRNAVTDVKYGASLGSLTSVPAGGAMSLIVGNTYYIQLFGGTATQGYNQFEAFVSFPNTIFQILSVSTTYSADSNTSHVPNPNSSLYADACTWDNNPNSPTYRSCIGGDDKAGGSNVVTTYQVKILSGGGTSQTLNTLLYDFSGSSYHYNSDFSSSSRIAEIIAPASMTISKSFNPKAMTPGGTSALTIKLTNPTPDQVDGITFTDSFPGGLTLSNTTTTNSCGGSLTDAGNGALNVGDTGIKLTGGTLAGNSICTITVNVTAAAGTYTNTTGNLFINTSVDTGNTASDTLQVTTASACVPGQTLVNWSVPVSASTPPDSGGSTAGSGTPGNPTTNNTGFTATAVHLPLAALTSQSIVTGSGSPDRTPIGDDTTWYSYGYKNDGGYVEFTVDTRKYSGVSMTFYVYPDSNGPTTLTVTYVGNGSGTAATYSSTAAPSTLTRGAWNTKTIDLSTYASTTGATTIRNRGYGGE